MPDDDTPDVTLLERYFERPDGSLELRYIPLTPEDFLNPRYGDKWLQGRVHQRFTTELWEIVHDHFEPQPDVVVTSDTQYRFGPGLPKPAPDVAVLRGVHDPGMIQESVDVQKVGCPCLLIEVVSPKDARIRGTDENEKVLLYQRVGIPEYLLVRPPRDENSGEPVRLWGYRLGPDRRYQPIEPDGRGRLLSKTTGLAFAVSPGGDKVDIFDVTTGQRLLRRQEVREAQKAAERRAAKAEEELARLRAEVARLKGAS